jgi:hypothetical protein
MSANTKVTKTKTALKQETYNLSDLKLDLHCGFKFVELGDVLGPTPSAPITLDLPPWFITL